MLTNMSLPGFMPPGPYQYSGGWFLPCCIFKRGVAVGQPRALNSGLMKTAFKLLLLSASFLSPNLFAESEWVSTPNQPGQEDKQVISLVMSADGQTLVVAERYHSGTLFWRSTDAGKNWSILTKKK